MLRRKSTLRNSFLLLFFTLISGRELNFKSALEIASAFYLILLPKIAVNFNGQVNHSLIYRFLGSKVTNRGLLWPAVFVFVRKTLLMENIIQVLVRSHPTAGSFLRKKLAGELG